MVELMDTILEQENIDPAFRVWITTEMHPQFPITLLQMSIKFTNEPPSGIKAGLKRTYTGELSNKLQQIYAIYFVGVIIISILI